MNEVITIDPDVCNGRTTVRGKRLAAQSILHTYEVEAEGAITASSIQTLLGEVKVP